MKNILTGVLIVFGLSWAHAALDEMVLVQGHITDSMDKSNIQILDNSGQKVFLPRKAFPKKFNFKQGKFVSIEVTDRIFDSLNHKSTKKK